MTEEQRNTPPEPDTSETMQVERCTECMCYFYECVEIDSAYLPEQFDVSDIVCEYCRREAECEH